MAQDWPVVGLQPEVEVQPDGRRAFVGTELGTETQDWPVSGLQPALEVQPAGSGAQDWPVVVLYPAVEEQPAGRTELEATVEAAELEEETGVTELALTRAAAVAGPTMPSAVRPSDFWKLMTAAWVSFPKIPSVGEIIRYSCKQVTLDPLEPYFKTPEMVQSGEAAARTPPAGREKDTAAAKSPKTAVNARYFFMAQS
jgi:hypothetical protein